MRSFILKLIMLLQFFNSFGLLQGQTNSSVHQFKARNIQGEMIDFALFSGKKILIVNTASKCGFTPQFKQLQDLYDLYKDKNFVLIGFPSNDFGEQDPGTNAQIEEFCQKNYAVTFLMMEKIHVKGDSIHPIYKWLTQKSENGKMSSSVKWNFQKYMVDEKGYLVNYVMSWKKPNCRKITRWLSKS